MGYGHPIENNLNLLAFKAIHNDKKKIIIVKNNIKRAYQIIFKVCNSRNVIICLKPGNWKMNEDMEV